jgi:hypothetical protein
MQGIYTYIPEINHAPMEHCDAVILMFMVRISLVPAFNLYPTNVENSMSS